MYTSRLKRLIGISALIAASFSVESRAQWDWTTNAPHMYNTNNGNVGIGYSTPNVKLRVEGATRILGSQSTTNSFPWWESATMGLYSFVDSDGGGLFSWNQGAASDDHADMVMYYGDDGNADLRFMRATWTGSNLVMYDVMSMSPLRNVGIGTTDPQARFHVQDGTVLFAGTGTTDALSGLATGNTPVSGAGTRLMWIPSKRAFRAGSVTGTQWDNANIGLHSFALGSDVAAYTDGSVAIGLNSIAGVAGGLNHGSFALGHYATSTGQDAFALGYQVSATADYSHAVGRDFTNNISSSYMVGFSATPTLFVNNTHVGINTTSPGAYSLYVSGTAFCTSSWSTSDERVKKDIRNIESPLANILRLRGATYNWRKEEFPERGFDDRRQIGLLAQDLEKVFPELVQTDENGFKAVNYNGVIPVLVEALKEEHAVVQSLKAENEQLRSTVETLMKRFDALESSVQSCCAQLQKSGNGSNPSIPDGAVLEQNDPNPFDGSTTIDYTIPQNFQSAELVVSNLVDGRKILSYTIRDNKGAVTLSARDWVSGTYLYSLIVDDVVVASKQMTVVR